MLDSWYSQWLIGFIVEWYSQWLMVETGDCQWLDSEWQWVTAILRKQKWAKSFPYHVANDTRCVFLCLSHWASFSAAMWLRNSMVICLLHLVARMVHWYPMLSPHRYSYDSYAIRNHMHMFANVDSIKSICSRCQWPSRFKDSEPFHSIPQARKILGLRHVAAAQEIQ
jgi:hypothetical protein